MIAAKVLRIGDPIISACIGNWLPGTIRSMNQSPSPRPSNQSGMPASAWAVLLLMVALFLAFLLELARRVLQ
jgi:hypothetical protein